MDLTKRKCKPCEKGGEPFDAETIHTYLMDSPGWESLDDKKIHRKFKFDDFVKALSFVNQVGDIAEMEGHHPDIHIHYNEVELELWTHTVKGLTENDFIMAAKISGLRM